MKYLILVPDGMFDLPCEQLQGKTPLEVAETPNMDRLALSGTVGRVKTIPRGFTPASDVANLNIIGYNPRKYYTGRGPLEAANIGVHLDKDDVAFRMNLVTIQDGIMSDYSAGHIGNKEAHTLVNFINQKLGSPKLQFYPGKSYRHLLVIRQGKHLGLHKTKTIPPHDILGKKINKFLPSGEGRHMVREIMTQSSKILETHEVNRVRLDLKENPANMIWLWGQGMNPSLPLFKDLYGAEGGIISAVDLIKGIGKLAGLEVVEVEGATGYYDTNYAGKASACLEVLKNKDFCFVHVESIDEAGHNGDIRAKISCIENFDKYIVGGTVNNLKGDFRVLIMPDHYTPVSLRTHTDWPVGFILYGKGVGQDFIKNFSEKSVKESPIMIKDAYKLVETLIKNLPL